MEFEFAIPGLAGQSISVWDSESIGRLHGDDVENLKLLLIKFGKHSAKAQGLSTPVTDLYRLRSTDQRLYLAATRHAGVTTVLGGLKTGHKKLFLRTAEGELREVQPVCVLDFYVHESCQRQGIGKQLFQYFLAAENVEAAGIAYDRPSLKLMGFLHKHFGLREHVTQNNNFVVFNRFWQLCPAVPSRGRRGERQASTLTTVHSYPATDKDNRYPRDTVTVASQQLPASEPLQLQPRSLAYQTNCLPRQLEPSNQLSVCDDGHHKKKMLQHATDANSHWQSQTVHTQERANGWHQPAEGHCATQLHQLQNNTSQQEGRELLTKSDSLDNFRDQYHSTTSSSRYGIDPVCPQQPFSESGQHSLKHVQPNATSWHNHNQPPNNQYQGYSERPSAMLKPSNSSHVSAPSHVAAGVRLQGEYNDALHSNDCNPATSKRNATGPPTSHVIPPWGIDQRQCSNNQQPLTSSAQIQGPYARAQGLSDAFSHVPARQLNGSNHRHDGSSAAGRPSMGSVSSKSAALAQRSGAGAAGCLVW